MPDQLRSTRPLRNSIDSSTSQIWKPYKLIEVKFVKLFVLVSPSIIVWIYVGKKQQRKPWKRSQFQSLAEHSVARTPAIDPLLSIVHVPSLKLLCCASKALFVDMIR
jgi:hypothetical protein